MADEEPESAGDGDEERVVRTVEPLDGDAHVTVPASWVGSRVEVVRTGPGEPDRVAYPLAGADDEPAFATPEPPHWAGSDVVEHLDAAADDPAQLYVGLATDGVGAYHATVHRQALAEGLAVVGADDRAPALLSNLAWQGVVGGAPGAVFARSGPAAEWFARALPEDRAAELQVVGGAGERSVNLLDPGVPPSSAAYFDAVDAVTDALVSLLIVVAPQLRDAIREFVMAASSTHGDTSLVELRELVRYGVAPEDADVPDWVPEKSPDLLDRVAGVDAEAVEWLLDSLAPLLEEPARSLLSDPDPDVTLVGVVRSQAPLVVQVGERYDDDTWRTVARGVTHGLWGAAREFVPDATDHPLYLAGDEFGSVLGAEDDLGRLLARLHRDRVVPAFGVRDPAALDGDHWAQVAEDVDAHGVFAPADAAGSERVSALDSVDADEVAGLDDGEFWLGGPEDPRHHLGYFSLPPRRPADALDWLA